ncbi:MAG: cytochrome c oxidase subunit II, partial [Candidatus Thermoplasmatota archaeon]|nr:cytochrome c oxidase subunit II [Candidatus Thermoplasmatota archaeon]
MSLVGDLLSLPTPTSWEAFSDGPLSLSQQVFYWSVIITIFVFGWLAYAVYQYRRKEGDPDPPDAPKAGVFPVERTDHTIEIAWTVGPLILVCWITWLSLGPLDDYWDVDQGDEMTVEVTASQWSWAFKYEDGSTTYGTLELPPDTRVKFEMESLDVLHAFYLPAFGLKEDIVPNTTTAMWFDTG